MIGSNILSRCYATQDLQDFFLDLRLHNTWSLPLVPHSVRLRVCWMMGGMTSQQRLDDNGRC